jgi:hypothetical protein
MSLKNERKLKSCNQFDYQFILVISSQKTNGEQSHCCFSSFLARFIRYTKLFQILASLRLPVKLSRQLATAKLHNFSLEFLKSHHCAPSWYCFFRRTVGSDRVISITIPVITSMLIFRLTKLLY